MQSLSRSGEPCSYNMPCQKSDIKWSFYTVLWIQSCVHFFKNTVKTHILKEKMAEQNKYPCIEKDEFCGVKAIKYLAN